MRDVVLISMPFGTVMAPALGLSLLKSGLTRAGISSTIQYFSIRFAELLGWSNYTDFAHRDGEGPTILELAGEWIFNGSLFDITREQEERYVREILIDRAAWPQPMPPIPREVIDRILRARSRAGRFLDWCVERVLEHEPRVVGFTSSFQQHVSSLALARRLKHQRPDTAIIFGGANCEGAMGAETVRLFPFVDAVVSGEGDVVVPELVRRLLHQTSIDGLPGIRTRGELERCPASLSRAPAVHDMDSLPFPDYSDFFRAFRASRFGRRWQPLVLFESSRGCWWGEKVHCSFCGLNGPSMGFRAKSARRALHEIAWLGKRHPHACIQAVDNILDSQYFDALLPELAKRRSRPSLFYETKSTLTREQVRMLRQAGITRIQPGIESLSDPILRLMRKGTTRLQNIQFLKWCRQFDIEASWNLMWGIPGEPPEEYSRMAELVPLLLHLPPPIAGGSVRLDRFSPYFEDPSTFGLTDVRPLESYRHIYPVAEDSVRNLAYSFSYGYGDRREPQSYTRRLSGRIAYWQSSATAAALFYADLGGSLLVIDLRQRGNRVLTQLDAVDRAMFMAADSAADLAMLTRSQPASAAEIRSRLDRLVRRRLMRCDDHRYLALAIPIGEYQPSDQAEARFRRAARRIGRRVSGGTIIDLPLRPETAGSRHGTRAKTFGKRSLFEVVDERTVFIRDRP